MYFIKAGTTVPHARHWNFFHICSSSSDAVGNTITLSGICCLAFHIVSFICIFIQLSADVFVALPILKAISELSADFSLTNSDSAFLLTPIIFAASVTDIFNGFITSSRKIFPGCVGFLVISITSRINGNDVGVKRASNWPVNVT
jgi:hypothetical protein